MSFNYSGMRDRAYSLVSRFGRDMTLRSFPAGAYDSATGKVSASPVVSKVKGVMITKRETKRRESEVTSATRQVIIAASKSYASPKKGDQVVFGSETLQIENVEALSPAGTDVIYICDVGR